MVEKLQIVTNPTSKLFQKVVEYINHNIEANAFPFLSKRYALPFEIADDWLQKCKNGEQLVAIAILNNNVVGAAHLDVEDQKYAKLNITVDRDHRRKGIGTKLVTSLIEQAKRRGIKVIRAKPRAENLAAIKLLNKNGFEIIGKETIEEEKKEIEYVQMILPLEKSTNSNILDALIQWRVETYDQIRHMERSNWQSTAAISTITMAFLALFREYSATLIWSVIFLVAINLLGIQMLFRNRRLFLQKVYVGDLTEKNLACLHESFRNIMQKRPEEWDVEKSPTFKTMFPMGSLFLSMVYVHILIIIIVHLWALSLILQQFHDITLASYETLLPIYSSIIGTIIVLSLILISYISWWRKQRWGSK